MNSYWPFERTDVPQCPMNICELHPKLRKTVKKKICLKFWWHPPWMIPWPNQYWKLLRFHFVSSPRFLIWEALVKQINRINALQKEPVTFKPLVKIPFKRRRSGNRRQVHLYILSIQLQPNWAAVLWRWKWLRFVLELASLLKWQIYLSPYADQY